MEISLYKSVGSDEFLTNKTQMLNRYRESKATFSHAPVKTRHGLKAESVFRAWLASFLPKKFGITKGSIVAPSVGLAYELREYDVIIYDKQNATIIWEEPIATDSDYDVNRCISSEEVLAVLEVKATLTKPNAKEALQKLRELNQYTAIDPKSDKRVNKLNSRFHCYAVFFELLKTDQNRSGILDELVQSDIFNYCGGLVLSAENDSMDCSGKIELCESSEPPNYRKAALFRDLETLDFRPIPDKSGIAIPPQGALMLRVFPYDEPVTSIANRVNSGTSSGYRWYYEKGYFAHSQPLEIGDSRYLYASLTWSKSMFAEFAFELKARLEGVFECGRAPSDHGLFFDGVI